MPVACREAAHSVHPPRLVPSACLILLPARVFCVGSKHCWKPLHLSKVAFQSPTRSGSRGTCGKPVRSITNIADKHFHEVVFVS